MIKNENIIRNICENYEDAEKLLTEAGFIVRKNVVKEGYELHQAGEVVEISLAPGSYPAGTVVTLKVFMPDNVVTDASGEPIIEYETTTESDIPEDSEPNIE